MSSWLGWIRMICLAGAVTATTATAACDEGSPTGPSGGAIVTFRVGSESFRVRLVTEEQVRAAEAARNGGSARIPVGRIVAGPEVNTGWSWHLVDVSFADATIELCDGLPSFVEREGVRYANGTYCPWGAQIVSIQLL